jgi:hypothetical protein
MEKLVREKRAQKLELQGDLGNNPFKINIKESKRLYIAA